MAESIRRRLELATEGSPVERPVYAVYDWFVEHRPHIAWESLFGLGLGRVNHANVVRHEHPNFELIEETREENGVVKRDVCLVTDSASFALPPPARRNTSSFGKISPFPQWARAFTANTSCPFTAR